MISIFRGWRKKVRLKSILRIQVHIESCKREDIGSAKWRYIQRLEVSEYILDYGEDPLPRIRDILQKTEEVINCLVDMKKEDIHPHKFVNKTDKTATLEIEDGKIVEVEYE